MALRTSPTPCARPGRVPTRSPTCSRARAGTATGPGISSSPTVTRLSRPATSRCSTAWPPSARARRWRRMSLSGFTTPLTGPVRSVVGLISSEGDRTSTGDGATLNSMPMTDDLNPPNNVFNSSISHARGPLLRQGARLRQPAGLGRQLLRGGRVAGQRRDERHDQADDRRRDVLPERGVFRHRRSIRPRFSRPSRSWTSTAAQSSAATCSSTRCASPTRARTPRPACASSTRSRRTRPTCRAACEITPAAPGATCPALRRRHRRRGRRSGGVRRQRQSRGLSGRHRSHGDASGRLDPGQTACVRLQGDDRSRRAPGDAGRQPGAANFFGATLGTPYPDVLSNEAAVTVSGADLVRPRRTRAGRSWPARPTTSPSTCATSATSPRTAHGRGHRHVPGRRVLVGGHRRRRRLELQRPWSRP